MDDAPLPPCGPGRRLRPDRVALALGVAFLAAQAWLIVLPALTTPADRVFLGYPHIPTDHLQYQMIVRQARDGGGPFYRNLYTTQPHDGRFLMAGLSAIGWLQRWTGLPDAAAWHGTRLAVLALCCALAWGLCRRLFRSRPDARIAFAFLLLAGGVDWAWPRLATWWTTGAASATGWGENPWNYSLFWGSCLLTWVMPLVLVLLLVRRSIDDATSPPGPGLPLAGGLLFAACWAIHPHSALVLGLLLGVLLLARAWRGPAGSSAWSRLARDAGLAMVGVVPVLAYLAWASGDPVFVAATGQASRWTARTPPWAYPLAYGPQLLLVAWGLGRDRDGERGFAAIQAWAAVALALSLNPWLAGAKYQFLLTVPLQLLEARGLLAVRDRLAARFPRFRPGTFAGIVLAVVSINTVQGLFIDDRPPPLRDATEATPSELAAMDALAALPPGGVLCEPRTGLLVPARTPDPVFVGHWFFSTRFAEKAELVRWFFASDASAERRTGFLDGAGIRWILHGPREAALGPVPDLPGLRLAWQDGDWSIREWTGSGP